MPNFSIEGFLGALKDLPFALFGGLTAACLLVLWGPGLGDVDPTSFRQSNGVYFWLGAIVFGSLTAARLIEIGVTLARHFKRAANTLQIIPARIVAAGARLSRLTAPPLASSTSRCM